MSKYEISYSVKGIRTKEIVSAISVFDAKDLIRMRYVGCNVTFWSFKRIG